MPKTKQFDEQEVLKKAKDLFSVKGYNGTSMDDLVQTTGLSRSSIYDTFGDKHGLFLKCLENYQCLQQNDMTTLFNKTDSPKKKIRSLFDHMVKDILADKHQKGCLMVNANLELSAVDKKVANIACTSMHKMEATIMDMIKEGQSKGEISKKHKAQTLARHLYNSYMGLRVTGTTRPDQDILKEIVKITLSILDE